MDQEEKSSCSWAYAVVALTAFIFGMALGQLGAVRDASRSRIEWPTATPPHPRSLQP
jgi:hypothetical protein